MIEMINTLWTQPRRSRDCPGSAFTAGLVCSGPLLPGQPGRRRNCSQVIPHAAGSGQSF